MLAFKDWSSGALGFAGFLLLGSATVLAALTAPQRLLSHALAPFDRAAVHDAAELARRTAVVGDGGRADLFHYSGVQLASALLSGAGVACWMYASLRAARPRRWLAALLSTPAVIAFSSAILLYPAALLATGPLASDPAARTVGWITFALLATEGYVFPALLASLFLAWVASRRETAAPPADSDVPGTQSAASD